MTNSGIFKQNVPKGERKPSVLWELIYNSDMTEPETHMNITDLILASIDTFSYTLINYLYLNTGARCISVE